MRLFFDFQANYSLINQENKFNNGNNCELQLLCNVTDIRGFEKNMFLCYRLKFLW